MDRVIGVIGAGRIGKDVISYIRSAPGYRLGRILTRSGVPDTGDAADFFGSPASIVIDTAGPDSLRAHGVAVLSRCDLWTVGSAALADRGFLEKIKDTCRKHSTRLRLFTPWISGITSVCHSHDAALFIKAQRPGLGEAWRGSLGAAVLLFPDELNSAIAAALCGPGIDRTTVELLDSGPDGTHRIDAVYTTAEGVYSSSVEFGPAGMGMVHPVSSAIIKALQCLDEHLDYG